MAEIIIALLSLVGTLGGSLGGIIISSKMTNYRLMQLEQRVAPELKEQAHNLLCEYWGEDYVKTIERALEMQK